MEQSRRRNGSCPIYWATVPDKSGNYKKVGDKTRPYGINHAVSRGGK